jgi:cytochrome c
MSSFDWNKVIASVLTALIVAMVSGILAEKLVAPTELAKPVFMVAGGPAKEETAAATPAGPPPIGPLLAKADAKKGEDDTKPCQVCHDFTKGGPNKVGPDLYGVVGEGIAEGHNGFEFSSALEKFKGQKWTPELLNKWLFNPQDFAPGTKMTFAGIDKDQQRADVIVYLESLK